MIKDNMYLGKICVHGHEFENTGQSIRYNCNNACVLCSKEMRRNYYQKNRERELAKSNKYNSENRERVRERQIEYRKNFPLRVKASSSKYIRLHKKEIAKYKKKYDKLHPYKCCASTAMRKAYKLKATPSYANKKTIARIYRTASILTKILGRTFQVDHIIPLKSKLVCGLHHEDNLQIISKERNLKKHNKFEPIII